MIILGEMNGLRVRTVSTSLGEWISSGNEWSQSPCHPVSGSTCPGLAIGAWCGKGTAPGRLVLAGGHASAWFSPFLAWPCTGSPKVPSGKETATLCPLDWPSNYSLLRLWHTNVSLHQTEARLRNQLSHSHMFAEWTVHLHRFAERVLFQQPAVYVAGHALQTNLRERNFPDRRVRRRVPPEDLDEHQRAIRALLQRAIAQQGVNPVSFGLTNEWNDTITSDKKHYLEHFTRGMT